MNERILRAVNWALTSPDTPHDPLKCQMWVRLTVEHEYGKVFASVMHKPSARLAGLSFQEDGRFVVPLDNGSVPGDLLYWLTGSGGFGHVGIRIKGNRIAQNSIVIWKRSGFRDARGTRPISEHARPDLIVRLR